MSASGAAGAGHGGWLARRAIAAWADLGASMRAELARAPRESELLFWVMLSGLLWFLGRAIILAAGPAEATGVLGARIGAEFITSVFFRTLAFYAVAGIAGLIARRLGGRGSWRETRAAVFWAALVAAPPTLAVTLFAALAGSTPEAPRVAADLGGGVLLAWAMARTLAEVHGFASPFRVLAVIVGVAVLLLAVPYGLARLA